MAGRFFFVALLFLLAVAAPAAAWSPPAEIARTDLTFSSDSTRVAADARGELTAAYRDETGALRVRRWNAADGAGSDVVVASGDEKAQAMRLAVAPNGQAALLWLSPSDSARPEDVEVHAATRPAGSDAWQAQRIERPAGTVYDPRIAVAPDGGAVIGWHSSTVAVTAAFRPPGGPFGAARPVSSGDVAFVEPTLAAEPDGRALIVFLGVGPRGQLLQEVHRTPAGWSSPATLSSRATGFVDNHAVATLPDGSAALLWSESRVSGDVVRLARGDLSRGFGSGRTLARRVARSLQLALTQDHGIVAAWRERGPSAIAALTPDRRGRRLPIVRFRDRRGAYPQLVVDADGNVTLMWQVLGARSTEFRTARARAGQPLRRGGRALRVPARTQLTSRIAMSERRAYVLIKLLDDLRAVRGSASGSFGATDRLSAAVAPSFAPELFAAASGGACAVWPNRAAPGSGPGERLLASCDGL